MKQSFRSLRSANYRLWAAGALVSNIGTWMQRIAQDWLVLTQLTQHSATAVGFVVACQFAPPLLLLPWTGLAADRLDRRKLLMVTQAVMGTLALILGLLTVTGAVQLWHVYACAALLGCASAFDAPSRQTFVAELVGDEDLPNAVALNSTSFNAARLVGPAIAGSTIAAVGSGWVFVVNAGSFMAVLVSLALLRVSDLNQINRKSPGAGGIAEGFRYVRARPDLLTVLIMLFLIGTFGFNFPIFILTMSVTVFHEGAERYGLLTSIMAVGSIAGALIVASVAPSMRLLAASALLFGLGFTLAAVMPSYWLFGAALVVVGVAAVVFSTATNSFMQLATEPAMRGRVLAIRIAVAVGATPVGAPLVGWIADHWGPRWGLGVGAVSGWLATAVAVRFLFRGGETGGAIAPAPPVGPL